MMLFLANHPTCTVMMEACAGSHYLARELKAMGHEAKIISPQFVKPFVKSSKNDFVDAQAICEAASRPSMRFVTPKSPDQQILSVAHRIRESLIRDRTTTVNQMHGILLEFGVSPPTGLSVIKRLASILEQQDLPVRLVAFLQRLIDHFSYVNKQIKLLDKQLERQLADDDLGSRLLSIPCAGPIQFRLRQHGMRWTYSVPPSALESILEGLSAKRRSDFDAKQLYVSSLRQRRISAKCPSPVMDLLSVRSSDLLNSIRHFAMRALAVTTLRSKYSAPDVSMESLITHA